MKISLQKTRVHLINVNKNAFKKIIDHLINVNNICTKQFSKVNDTNNKNNKHYCSCNGADKRQKICNRKQTIKNNSNKVN